MIQANELRLGNLLNSDKDTHSHTRKVSGIGHENHIVYLDSIHNRISSERIDIGHLKPIPLTEEWLLKLGAKEVRIGTNLFEYDRFYLRWHPQYKYWYVTEVQNNAYITKVEYVHEWQNAVFALNGQELEVKS
jgi:hypothetical protein